MNILFIVPSYKPAYIYGGPIVSVARLAESLVQIGHTVTVYTTTANGPDELDMPLDRPVMMDGVRVQFFRRITKDHTHVSPALWKAVWHTVKEYDAVHIHSWWNFLIMGVSAICAIKGIKPVLSPRGMLCDYVFQSKNQFKKKLLHHAVGKHLLSRTFLHVTSDVEWNDCLKINTNWRGGLIHNIVDLPFMPGLAAPQPENREFTIGFLSRVDPKKGLDILIRALAGVEFPFRLKIAGAGDAAYEADLRSLITEEKLEDKVEWAGWKKGEAKFEFLADVDLFALTSHNENFAVVVIESLAVGTPVLVSEHVGLSRYVKEKHLGWVTTLAINDVRARLTEAYRAGNERQRIRREAMPIIRTDFNEEKLAADYAEMYRNVGSLPLKRAAV
ncbi:XrtY-associated glycosyltransferase XYAG1 [Chitinophaga rhizosphaerae]|uniref:XrtY-associated glycosyltransferase XYAG1 n=1 Tax=Chitinophaga rhizosphaerae TaxID=1864947 RepID=UPI000F80E288|nr:glycosyltransferase [Chitinophaga rhizosphaerae]